MFSWSVKLAASCSHEFGLSTQEISKDKYDYSKIHVLFTDNLNAKRVIKETSIGYVKYNTAQCLI
jgi:hypothetical protein